MICDLDELDQDNEVGAFNSDISTDISQYFHFDGQDPNLTIG
jgi:hypothetical protein